MPTVFQLISTLVVVAGAILAWTQYARAQRFRRIQNLSMIWEKFFKEPKLRELFTLLNDVELGNRPASDLAKTELNTDKLHYLALLEDVALYARLGEVDREYAVGHFQWFFIYAFERESTRDAFWAGLGGTEERGQPYWSLSRAFAAECARRSKA